MILNANNYGVYKVDLCFVVVRGDYRTIEFEHVRPHVPDHSFLRSSASVVVLLALSFKLFARLSLPNLEFELWSTQSSGSTLLFVY